VSITISISEVMMMHSKVGRGDDLQVFHHMNPYETPIDEL